MLKARFNARIRPTLPSLTRAKVADRGRGNPWRFWRKGADDGDKLVRGITVAVLARQRLASSYCGPSFEKWQGAGCRRDTFYRPNIQELVVAVFEL